MSKTIRIGDEFGSGPVIDGVGWLSREGAALLREAGDEHLAQVAAWLERYGDYGYDGLGHMLVPALWDGRPEPDDPEWEEWVAAVAWLEETAYVLAEWAVDQDELRLRELAEVVRIAAGLGESPYIWV